MQDRFKFRVFLKYNQIMCDIDSYCFLQELNKCVFHFTNGGQKTLKNDDFILIQCTGLKDRNGKLIYEGDIVQFYDDELLQTMKIIWDNDELDFKAIGLKKSVECYEGDFSYLGYIKKEDSLEVIGNIYKNPELLKEYE